MTSGSIPQRRAPRRGHPLQLAGNTRNQEANRKSLLRELKRFERKSQSAARKASTIAAILAGCDAPEIARNRPPTRYALRKAVNLDDFEVSYWVARLLGVDRSKSDNLEVALLRRIYGWDEPVRPERDAGTANDSAPQPVKAPASVTFSAEAVLAEATRIVADAAGESGDRGNDTSAVEYANIRATLAELRATLAELRALCDRIEELLPED